LNDGLNSGFFFDRHVKNHFGTFVSLHPHEKKRFSPEVGSEKFRLSEYIQSLELGHYQWEKPWKTPRFGVPFF